MDEMKLNEDNLIKNYLGLFKLSEKKYVIGIFQEGITIYKQQVRSLNIFQTLVKAEKIDIKNKNFKIGVVGGGVAGLTFAAAAAKMDIKVTIFEHHPILMHMQFGCDTRIVHPNLYDWPNKSSVFPYAEIPILQWKANTASHVAKQLIHSFQQIKKESQSGEIRLMTDTEIKLIRDDEDENNIYIRYNKKGIDKFASANVDLLIFATGYGIEKGVNSSSKTPSYWRNDDYAQTILGQTPKKYLLSGVGDGGLLDLFRLKILGFSLDSFLKHVYKLNNYHELFAELNAIKDKWKKLNKKEKEKKGWLDTKFERACSNYYPTLINEYFKARIIDKCEVWVHGKKEDFLDNLNPDKISLLNAFIAFIISKMVDCFAYTNQILEERDNYYTLGGVRLDYEVNQKIGDLIVKKRVDYIVIIRNGPSRDTIPVGFLNEEEKGQLEYIEKQQQENTTYNNTNLLYGYSSLYTLLNKSERPDRNFSFYTPETSSICSSFVAVLANAMKYHQINKHLGKNFRIGLTRIVNLGSGLGYQQITPYFGNDDSAISNGVGRVFGIDTGIVGLAAKSGKIININNTNEAEFEKLTRLLKLEGDISKYENSKSLLAIPIFGRTNKTDFATNLVCFFESDSVGFFDNNPPLIILMMLSIGGFLNYIKTSLSNNEIIMSEVDFTPYKIDKNFDFSIYKNSCFQVIPEESLKFWMPNYEQPSFNDYLSFDITYNETVDFLPHYQGDA